MKTSFSKRILRSDREIRKMRVAGLLVWQSHQAAFRKLRAGITTAEINDIFRDAFASRGAKPLFLGYGPADNPFPAETCISVNEELVHGIPGNRRIRVGDIVSLDTGCAIDGWCGDAAVTHLVGEVDAGGQKLVAVTQRTLDLAVDLLGRTQWWSEIAAELQAFVEGHGFGVAKALTGHGIGRQMHEPPQAPNYWSSEFSVNDDFDIRPGLVFACEPMVTERSETTRELDDGWTIVAKDKGRCAHFEHTIAITKEGPVRLTGPPEGDELELVPDEFRDPSSWYRW